MSDTSIVPQRLSAQSAPVRPGPEHQLLQQFEGDWDFVATFDGEPDSSGVSHMRMDYGGFWLIEEDEFHSEQGRGHGMMGYDPGRGKYILTGICSMGPGFCYGEGDADSSGMVFTFDAWFTEPRATVTRKARIVCEIDGHDAAAMSFYDADGKPEHPFGRFNYTRRKRS